MDKVQDHWIYLGNAEKVESACCCQTRTRGATRGGLKEALAASNDHDQLPLTQHAWSLCGSCPSLEVEAHLASAQVRTMHESWLGARLQAVAVPARAVA